MEAEDLLFENSAAVVDASIDASIKASTDASYQRKKDRLLAIILSGKSKAFLGHLYSSADIEAMKPEDFDALYMRYENALGAKMTNNLGKTIVSLYCKTANWLFPIDSVENLNYDLETNPVISSAVGSLSCWLFFNFGNYLAPLMAGLITSDHINLAEINLFNNRDKSRDGREEGGDRREEGGDGNETQDS